MYIGKEGGVDTREEGGIDPAEDEGLVDVREEGEVDPAGEEGGGDPSLRGWWSGY